MKKILLVTILILLLQTLLFGSVVEDYVLEENTYILTGAIDDKFPITMYLTINTNNEVTGKYYYDKMKKYINVNGEIKGSTIKLEEEIDSNITGEFSGKFDKKNIKYSGTWINAKTKKSMPFSLVKNKIYAVNHIEMFHYSFEDIEHKYYYKSLMPKIVNSKNLKSIGSMNDEFAIDDEIKKSINKEYDEHVEYFDEWSIFEHDISLRFKYIDKNIISFVTKFYEHTGGAHGYGGSAGVIYNIKTGKVLNETSNDLIDNPKNEKLIALMKKNLLKDYSEDEFFNFDEITLNDNYYIDVEGVHFIFTPYEIGPWSTGQVYLSFSFDELKPYVKRSSPFYYLFE